MTGLKLHREMQNEATSYILVTQLSNTWDQIRMEQSPKGKYNSAKLTTIVALHGQCWLKNQEEHWIKNYLMNSIKPQQIITKIKDMMSRPWLEWMNPDVKPHNSFSLEQKKPTWDWVK